MIKYVLLLMLLSSCVEAKQACDGIVTNKLGQSLAWSKLPIHMSIDKTVPEDLRPAIYSAAEKWNKAMEKKVIVIDGVVSKAMGRDDINVIKFNSSWNRKAVEQAYTRVHFLGDEIVEADTEVNADLGYYYGVTGYVNKYNLEALVIHEMGHVLGLSHDGNETSVMYEHLAKDQDRIEVTEVDLYHLQCEYK